MSLPDDGNLPPMDELTLSDTEAMKKTSVNDMGLDEVERLRAKFNRFRVLIFGRANAGKTSILAQICRSTKDKAIRTRDGEQASLVNSIAFYFTDLGVDQIPYVLEPTDQVRIRVCQ